MIKPVSFRNDVLPLKDILYRLALRITQERTEAEDIVQDTLIRIWNRREQWDEIESIEAFALTVCRNLALDRVSRHDNAHLSLDEQRVERPDQSPTPLDHAQQRDRIDMVRRLVDALPEKQRSCMQLRDFEGKPYKDIAAILGISEQQVKVNIFRARQTIKQKFQQIDDYGL